jgi:predicted DNA-binding transcriptional regulator AlpA
VLIDPLDLIDASEAAEIIGMTNPGGVSVYRRRYSDFPAPIIEKGRCVLWLRQDIEAWARGRGRDATVTHEG